MNKIGKIFLNYKITITIILLLIASFFVYYFVFANEDIYENQIKVTNIDTNIIDGTSDFDQNDEAGNDSSNNNKIVRSFDQITYNISYKLDYKEDSTIEDRTLDVTRDVIIDVLVPKDIYMKVSEDDVMNEILPQKDSDNRNMIIDDRYYYYQIIKHDCHIAETSNVEVILSTINGKNGDIISPIIQVREATDDVIHKEITPSINSTTIDKINVDNVTVSAKERYGIKLFQGVKKEENDNTNVMPVGVMVYLPNQGTKGIKGVQVPSELSFDLNINSSSDTSRVLESDDPITNYTSDSGYVVADLPYSYSSNNGNAGIDGSTLNQNRNSVFNIRYTNLKFTKNTNSIDITPGNSTYYLSTKIFLFKSKRNDKNDITYTINTNAPISNTIDDYLDNYVPFVGDFVSKIDFFNNSQSTSETPTFEESGKAIYNYNEEFYIQNTINYGNLKGDKLDRGFTNYIKIDNTSVKLLKTPNASDETLDYYLEIDGSDPSSYNPSVQYGIGEWTSSYFKLKTDRPSYCPSTLNNLSKEDLMNLYGGPCIEDNNIIWVDSIQDAIDSGKDNKIILFKLNVPEKYATGVQTIVRLKAKAVKNYSNIGKTFMITSRGKTTYNNRTYYLSQIANSSVSNHSMDMKYNKTTYDANYNITGGNTTIVNTNTMQNIGNTILISPFKASISPIELHDSYNSIGKTTFYSGMTDPIEFVINPIIYKSDFEATITGATVSVYLPETLEIYEKSSDKAYDRSTSGNLVTIDGVNYRVYNYNYSESDINFEEESASGTIPILKVHAYIALATKDNTNTKVITKISGTLKTNQDATTIYTDVTPIEKRTTSVNINLRNTKDVNSIGKTNLSKIDKNGSYQYNMRAANNLNESSEIYMMYILPYSGDGIGKGSDFSGTNTISILNQLPSGYNAYYTNDNAKTLLNKEITDATSINWKTWSNINTPLSGITAIKIVPTTSISAGGYFASKDGITLNITTRNNKELDKYYNNFYMIQKNADVCVDDDTSGQCSRTEKKTISYSSNISLVSVYNRTISGYAFEDSNYDGFYSKEEPKIKNVVVDLYKLKATSFDSKNPVASISDEDELINDKDVISDNNGYYKFEDIQSGNYYLKYTFNCDKYTTTEKNKVDPTTEGDASNRDSDAQMIERKDEKETKCYAVSNILTLNNNTTEHSHIDLGLRVRQEFDVKIRKYITNVKVLSNGNVVRNLNYNNKTKVNVDVKNLKNTSFKVTYGIEIENNKYFPGTIGNIIETIPEGMTFNPNLPENDGWYENDGNLYYSYFNKSLIMPGEKYHLTIVLDLTTNSGGDYINLVAANNLQIKPVITNFLEIPEDTEIIIDDGGDE